MKSWSDIGFEVEMTGDSSPSLRLLNSVDPEKYRGESMHHSGGACAETLLIYGEPAREVLERIEKPQFLVMGLGLGYIELCIAREALLLGKAASDIGLIRTYESVLELREFFYLWLWERQADLHPEVWAIYEAVAHHILRETPLAISDLKAFLREHFQHPSDLCGAILKETQLLASFHCILYDAFSSKTSPFLWEEEFLNQFLHQGAAEVCQFSTYACKASLKRALSHQGFHVVVREGFQGKRNSTLGLKNWLK